jgi:peptide/nickel transport system permease protein
MTYFVTFFVAATIDWLIPRFMPGDPVTQLVARTTSLSPTAAAALRDYYTRLFGFDQPLPVQYLNFWGSLLKGDLGVSVYGLGRPVTEMLMAALPYTMALLIPAITLSWLAGNWVGAYAARRKRLDNTVLPLGYVLTATPYMWLALVLSFIIGYTFKWLPAYGSYSFSLEPTLTWTFFWDLVAHWFLPFLSLFLVQFGGWAIGMRNMIIYELESDYAHYLEALGAPQRLIRKYAFKNALLPQITGLALSLGAVIAGALVTEIVFSYPGLGYQIYRAITNEDYFVIQGVFLFIIVGVLVANFVVDIVYIVVDPRTRIGMQGGQA